MILPLGKVSPLLDHHIFDGNDYLYWKTRMRICLQALDYEIWEIVSDGPMTKNEVREDIPKSSC